MVNYYYWQDDTNISALIRKYIDAPIEGLLEKTFPKEQINIEHHFPKDIEYSKINPTNWDATEEDPNYIKVKYNFNLGLTDLFKAADRRIGKDKLLQWAFVKNNATVKTILNTGCKTE